MQKGRILVVDDEPDMCHILELQLSRAGYKVESVLDAGSAYIKLSSDLFDLVLTDLMMPGMDGMEFLEKVKQQWPAIPVVMVTGYATISTAMQAMKPAPDNIFLLTDGLPTMDSETTSARTVSGSQRLAMFSRAANRLPSAVPINVFLYPLEGDYQAAFAYWVLSARSGGSFISVSRDWP